MPRFLPPVLLILLLAGCGQATSATSSHAAGPQPLVHLPHDQAAHPDSYNEWWYIVGHMRSGNRTFGYEVTAFRFSHVQLPGASPTSPASSLYRTDVAITDESHRRFYQKITYYFPQSAQLSSSALNVHVGKVSLAGPMGGMKLHASMPSGSIALTLASQRPAMNVGGRGYLRFPTGFTYYYSLTDLRASGTIAVGGRTFHVTGISWLDHQWGNWTWTKGGGGWTWMAIQLHNGVQFSLFDVHSSAGHVYGVSLLDAQGHLHTSNKVAIQPRGRWLSPHTAGNYPSGWTVRIPTMHIALTVTPTVIDQELVDPTQARGSYWEGSGRVTGTENGKPVTGDSYTELTGIARHVPQHS